MAMEQFEKWAGPTFYYGKNPLNRPILEAKRKAWRAALKWVRDNANGDSLDSRDVYSDVVKELGNDDS